MTPEWGALDRRLAGSVVSREAATYEDARQSMVWNARKPDRFPDAIVRVSVVDDVSEAIRFARTHQLKVAVRGGGHSWCGSPVRDGGLLLDLSALARIEVDAAARRATVQPGVTGRAFLEALTPHGLAFPVGHCPSVPLSGFLLAGGFGWNSGSWGPACASILGIEFVDADGTLRYADVDRSADLLWAARGAGAGFFGVVTSFDVALHPLPPSILTSTLVFPMETLDEVAAWLPQVASSLPREVELSGMIARPPPELAAVLGAEHLLTLSATAFADSDEQARLHLSGLESGIGTHAPVKDLCRQTPLSSLHDAFGELFPEGSRYVADVLSTSDSLQEVAPRLRDTIRAAPSPRSLGLFVLLPPAAVGAAAELPDMALTVFGETVVALYGIWDDPAQDEAHDRWMDAAGTTFEPIRAGRYIGETDLTRGVDRARECYSAEDWERLQELKRRHDPRNTLFSYLGRSTD